MNTDTIDILILRYAEKSATEKEIKQLWEWVNSKPENEKYFIEQSNAIYSTIGANPNFSASEHFAKVKAETNPKTLKINGNSYPNAEGKALGLKTTKALYNFRSAISWVAATLVIGIIFFFTYKKSERKDKDDKFKDQIAVNQDSQNLDTDTLSTEILITEKKKAPHITSISVVHKDDSVILGKDYNKATPSKFENKIDNSSIEAIETQDLISSDSTIRYDSVKQILYCSKAPLKRVIPIFERSYNRKMKFKNNKIKRCLLSGTIYLNQDFEEIRDMLGLEFSIMILENNGTFYLYGEGCD